MAYPDRLGFGLIALAIAMGLGAPAISGPILATDLDQAATYGAADVVIIGEVHDNPTHHAHQARAVATLQPKALVFEMLASGFKVTARPEGQIALAKALGWDSAGWPDFALYYPIFAAAPDAAVYGAEVSRDKARQAFKVGIAAVFGADAAGYGLTDALPPGDQAAREEEQAQAHCNALPADLLPGMVDVQRLRDAALARAVVQALADTGGPVVVITGTGHARTDVGLPSVLARVAPQAKVLSIGQLEEAPEPAPPFDLWLISDPTAREDPCKAFAPG